VLKGSDGSAVGGGGPAVGYSEAVQRDGAALAAGGR
jgi:hypothetical protein